MPLGFPFQLSRILRQRHRIKDALLETGEERAPIRLAIAGSSTTDEIAWLLELFLLERGILPQIHQLDFNQYFQASVLGSPELESFEPHFVYLHVGLASLPATPELADSADQVSDKLNACLEHYLIAVDGFHKRFGATVILNNLPYPQYRVLGNLDGIEELGLSHFILELNRLLAEASKQRSFLVIQDVHYLSAQVGIDNFFDWDRYHSYRIVESFSGAVHLAHNLSRVLSAQLGRTKKVAVLDLDNTLWGGVIADEGIQGIRLGQSDPLGEQFILFQDYLRQLSRRGVLLAVASKNDEHLAKQGFSHPASRLGLADISSFQAHWDTKDKSIGTIASELNLNQDCFVFVDDNPAERALVKDACPDVQVLEANEPLTFLRILDREGYFEPSSLTQEDLARVSLYSSESARKRARAPGVDYQEYLIRLGMRGEFGPIDKAAQMRAAQLINKTNQFNVTSLRVTEAELARMLNDPRFLCLMGLLDDQFGAHGIITVVVGEVAGTTLHLSHWLMSCRVLKRGVEFAMFEHLVQSCRERGVEKIVGYYIKTEKNAMVANLYPDLGFREANPGGVMAAGSVFEINLAEIAQLPEHQIAVDYRRA